MSGTLLDLERELAGVLSMRDMSDTVLDSIQRFSGASGATLFRFDDFAGVRTQGGSLESAMSAYTPDLFPEDAMQRWSLAMPGSTFICDGTGHPEGRTFDFAAHKRTRPYADFYRPLDIAFVMGIWPTGLSYGAPHMFGLLLTKPHPFRPFASDVLAQLRHLEMPLRLAARRIAQFRALEQSVDMLDAIVQRKPGSFVLWDPEGHLTWASAQAQRQLVAQVRRGDLERAARLARGQLRHRAVDCRDGLLGRPCRLRSPGGPPMLVAFSWISGRDRRPWLLAELQCDPRAASPLKRLTAAETRLLRLLVRGCSNTELCERLDISKETVKTHLRRIYVKLNVSSRAKAVRLASELWRT